LLQRMSSEGSGERLSKKGTRTSPLGTTSPEQSGEHETTQSRPKSPPPQKKEGHPRGESATSQTAKKPAPQSTPTPPATTTTEGDVPALVPSSEGQDDDPPRQVIAVSASKGPAAFFNLARKFLATDEMCDLSALEGAIVSAVDAAHLLERSQLATIVRVNTSYVTVEPKKRKLPSQGSEQEEDSAFAHSADSSSVSGSPLVTSTSPAADSKPPGTQHSPTQEIPSAQPSTTSSSRGGRASGRELRRARIVITVRRTESYKRWLEENPLQAIIASEEDADAALEQAPGSYKKPE